ncbi:autotransporter adhesin [Actinobacillus equuli]|nr:autotransporter adhesin [Actinobacillus equuli]
MNKIFKVIWNHTTQTFVVTSELSKAKGKSSSSTDERSLPTRNLLNLGTAALVLGTTLGSLDANAAYSAGGGSVPIRVDAISIGTRSVATVESSTAIGTLTSATALNSTAIGYGLQLEMKMLLQSVLKLFQQVMMLSLSVPIQRLYRYHQQLLVLILLLLKVFLQLMARVLRLKVEQLVL